MDTGWFYKTFIWWKHGFLHWRKRLKSTVKGLTSLTEYSWVQSQLQTQVKFILSQVFEYYHESRDCHLILKWRWIIFLLILVVDSIFNLSAYFATYHLIPSINDIQYGPFSSSEKFPPFSVLLIWPNLLACIFLSTIWPKAHLISFTWSEYQL